jgi:hypothetical protein
VTHERIHSTVTVMVMVMVMMMMTVTVTPQPFGSLTLTLTQRAGLRRGIRDAGRFLGVNVDLDPPAAGTRLGTTPGSAEPGLA